MLRHSGLSHPYRLGNVIIVQPPNEGHRRSLFEELLGSPQIAINFNVSDAIGDAFEDASASNLSSLCLALARRTQGLLRHDIVHLVKEQLDGSWLRSRMSSHPADLSPQSLTAVEISARRLLSSAYCNVELASTSLVTWSPSEPAPRPLGVENLQRRLLTATVEALQSSISEGPLAAFSIQTLKRLLDVRPCSGCSHTTHILCRTLLFSRNMKRPTTYLSSS